MFNNSVWLKSIFMCVLGLLLLSFVSSDIIILEFTVSGDDSGFSGGALDVEYSVIEETIIPLDESTTETFEVVAVCGNGVIDRDADGNSPEECDYGYGNNNGSSYSYEPEWFDPYVEPPYSTAPQCDTVYACDSSCQLVIDTGDEICNDHCGDGLINDPSEECDGLELGGESCSSFTVGAALGDGLSCDSSCQMNTSECLYCDDSVPVGSLYNNVECTDDSIIYSYFELGYTYGDIEETNDNVCVNFYDGTTTSWQWITSAGGGIYAFEANGFTNEFCGDGFDNNCNAYQQFDPDWELAAHSRRDNHGELTTSIVSNNGRLFTEIVLDQSFEGGSYSPSEIVDRFDPACFGNVTGRVEDSLGEPIENARIDLIIYNNQGIERVFNFTYSNANGDYSFLNMPAYSFGVMAVKSGYEPAVVRFDIPYQAERNLPALVLENIDCRSDCTTVARPGVCDAACDGFAGCQFNNSVIASYLDGRPAGVSILVPGEGTVESCEGAPDASAVYREITDTSVVDIQCPDGKTLLIIERIALNNGEPVKLKIPVCR